MSQRHDSKKITTRPAMRRSRDGMRYLVTLIYVGDELAGHIVRSCISERYPNGEFVHGYPRTAPEEDDGVYWNGHYFMPYCYRDDTIDRMVKEVIRIWSKMKEGGSPEETI